MAPRIGDEHVTSFPKLHAGPHKATVGIGSTSIRCQTFPKVSHVPPRPGATLPAMAMAAAALALLFMVGERPAGAGNRMAVAHSHNDYEQEHPLADALRYGYRSVEADVWWSGKDVVVSHFPWWDVGGLEDLYLRPLQERVDRLGSVYGDGNPFYLWIELKQSRRELVEGLRAILNRYQMFAVFTDSAVSVGPVIAVLTGDEEAKARFIDGSPTRRACRDSNRISPSDPPGDLRWAWYALRWEEVVDWDGRGSVPDLARRRLEALVRKVHDGGRRLRLYEVPERPAVWAAAIAAGVDLVGTDRLAELHDFLVPPRFARTVMAATHP
jgi:hypothetical protein